jgi:hypothetical protein
MDLEDLSPERKNLYLPPSFGIFTNHQSLGPLPTTIVWDLYLPPSTGAPHPRFPVKPVGFRTLHAPFLKERRTRGPVQRSVQEIRGISLVFREMWDTADLNVFFLSGFKKFPVWGCGIPHLAKNERDVGHPSLAVRTKVSRRWVAGTKVPIDSW